MPSASAPLAGSSSSSATPAAPPVRSSPLLIHASTEQLLVATSLFWALSANRSFLAAALAGRALDDLSAWGYGLALFVLLVALHLLLLLPFATRRSVKPLLALLIVTTAAATHFMQRYGIYLDPDMVRNVLHSDPAEARELLSGALALHLLLYAGLPLLLLRRVRIVARPWRRTLLLRVGLFVGAAAVGIGTLVAVFQPFSALVRNQREVRYLITPANYLWSLTRAASVEARGAVQPRQAIGTDAKPGPSWVAATRPRVLVMVVGETARAANWGLNGYARQTTPELAQLPLASFTNVDACGTNTEVSLPCMFAPVGRRDYDEARIRGSESLLHVLARAGVGVHWLDNQSGCKGVCDGLPNDTVASLGVAGLCPGGRCLDEGLLQGLDARLDAAGGTQLLVLHMLGNHGPSYFRRYPPAFARFQPDCRHDDLRRCSVAEIVNAYDNALLYTDHVLAELIRRLQAHGDRVDSAMLYVSDHGESLGESGLFLHGLPYPIAPEVQTRVPMLMWSSPGFAQATGVQWDCVRAHAAEPTTHDHLFHTLLGLLDVHTQLYDPQWDRLQRCRLAELAHNAR